MKDIPVTDMFFFLNIFPLFRHKNLLVDDHWNRLIEAIPMITHMIGFEAEIKEVFL